MPSPTWLAAMGGAGPLQRLFAIGLVVAMLSRGQAFLVPVAVAVFLAFVLIPPVRAIERLRVPRAIAIALVLACSLTLVAGLTYVLTAQFRELAAHMPEYSDSIKDKLATLRLSRHGAIASIQKTVERATRELDEQDGTARTPGGRSTVQSVAIVPAPPTDVERLQTILAPVAAPLVEAGFVIVLVAFLLAQREDLRNRVIRLVGTGRVTLTTRTLDEAGQRISRYLLTQSAINAAFGLVIACGLYGIGVPYAVLWGVVAALLRFAPYVGALLAMAMPIAIAAVLFDGWGHVLATAGLFVAMDALTANVVEPVLVGTHTGVSSLALLVAAFFWALLWGPIGLLLSTPITLCLAVVGKHVTQLEFLSVVLGDDAVLEPEVTVYQRLLAGDEDEANDIVEQAAAESTLAEVFGTVLLPAIVRSADDRAADRITDADHESVLRATARMIDRLAERDAGEIAAPAYARTIVAVPARDQTDEVAAEMLARLLDGHRLQQLSTSSLVSEVVSAASAPDVVAVCVVALPPGGLAHARHLCKRIRAMRPALPIVVVRPGHAQAIEGADATMELVDARRHLDDLGNAPMPVASAS
ncbi:MAG TPA: AI-2E family transporter [Candidatus Eisenbacteria bacterium]|nr:AI-2E family transporter [Candidatus Eisenbacteria bacterium]